MYYVQREKKNFTPEDAALGKSAYQYVETAAPKVVDSDLVVTWGNQNRAAPFALETAVVDGVEVLGARDIADMLGAEVTMFEQSVPATPPPDTRTDDEKRQARVAERQARKAAEAAEAAKAAAIAAEVAAEKAARAARAEERAAKAAAAAEAPQ